MKLSRNLLAIHLAVIASVSFSQPVSLGFVPPTSNRGHNRHTSNWVRRSALQMMDLSEMFRIPTTIIDGALTVDADATTTPLASLPSLEGLPGIIFQVQRIGENVFTAMVFVAFAQAMVALVQYRTNPTGQLITPPGLTFGTSTPKKILSNVASKQLVLAGNGVSGTPAMTDYATSVEKTRSFLPRSDVDKNTTTISTEASNYSAILNRINRWLVLLIPWASQKLGWILRRNTHLFHFGFIMALAGVFDVPNRWFASWEEKQTEYAKQRAALSASTRRRVATVASDLRSSLSGIDRIRPRAGKPGKPVKRVIVIGDSLAIGLGSVNIFDATHNNSVPFCLIENVNAETTDSEAPGPVFPRVLADTFANHYRSKVHWRSGGVDGGDVALIQHYCLDIIKQETDQGRAPDVVVILCGANDFKNFISNPFRAPGPREFRQRLTQLLREIQLIAPHTKIILPMLPTQSFRANSPLNIFPLSFFLDGVVGFWDSQKKLVADRYPSDNVVYVGLRAAEIFDWYQTKHDGNNDKEDDEEGLMAADGIHPNAKCYASWAKFLVEKLVADPAPM